MKNSILIILFFMLFIQSSFGETNSANGFSILINNVPNGENKTKPDSKLSDGAITAITLGSIFAGLSLAGIGYHFYKKGVVLNGEIIRNKACALIPDCIYNIDSYKTKQISNFYLNKIFENEKLDKTCEKKYILIEDRYIKSKNYHRYYFKPDKQYSNLRIIQYSKPFKIINNIPNLNNKIYINNTEIALSTKIIDFNFGRLIKTGKYDFIKEQLYFIDIALTNSNSNNIYAIIIEFN